MRPPEAVSIPFRESHRIPKDLRGISEAFSGIYEVVQGVSGTFRKL